MFNLDEIVKEVIGEVDRKEEAAVLAIAACFISYKAKLMPLELSATLMNLIQDAVGSDSDKLMNDGSEVASRFVIKFTEMMMGKQNETN